MKRRREPLTRASDFAHFHRACGQRTIPRALHDHGFYGIDQAALPQNVLEPDLDLQTIRRAHARSLPAGLSPESFGFQSAEGRFGWS